MKYLKTAAILIFSGLFAFVLAGRAHAAPVIQSFANIAPFLTDTYDNGTSTNRWLHGYFKFASTTAVSGTTFCLGTDCRTVWPSGVGSGLATTTPISGSNVLVYSSAGAGAAYGAATSSATINNGLTGLLTTIGSGQTIGLSTINAGVLGATLNGVVPTSQATSTLYGASTGGKVLGWDNALGGIGWVSTSTVAAGTASTTLLTDSNTFSGGSGNATTTFSQGLKVTATGNVSASVSAGGIFTGNNTLNDGAGMVWTTAHGSGATGRLAVFNCTNSAFDDNCVHFQGNGTQSVINVLGATPGKGTVKIGPLAGAVSDNNSSGLSIDCFSNSYQGQCLFLKGNSATTTPILSILDSGSNTAFKVDGNRLTTFINGSSTQLSVSGNTYLTGLSAGVLYVGSGSIVNTAASSSIFGYTPLNPTRALTVAGTANQITSSAGSQDLSADRTWTLSLPANVIFPIAFNATYGTTTYASSTALTAANLAATNATSSNLTLTGGAANCNGTSALTTTSTGVVNCTAQPQGTVTSVSGTANQISSTGGATPVLSLPSHVIFPGNFQATNATTTNATTTSQYITGQLSKLLTTDSVGQVIGTSSLGIAYGGTGSSTSLGGILAGNGFGAIKSVVIGSNLTWDGTTLSATGGSGTFAWTPTTYNALAANATSTSLWNKTALSAGYGFIASSTYTDYASTTQITSTGNAYLATAGGSVGIGTTSPYLPLSVAGNAVFTGISYFTNTLVLPVLSALTTTIAGAIGIDTTTGQLRWFDGTNTHVAIDEYQVGTFLASSTLSYLGVGGSATTSFSLSNPRYAATTTSIYCKTNTGRYTIQLHHGGTSSTTAMQCTSSGTELTSYPNGSYTAREDVFLGVGSVSGSPNGLTVTITQAKVPD